MVSNLLLNLKLPFTEQDLSSTLVNKLSGLSYSKLQSGVLVKVSDEIIVISLCVCSGSARSDLDTIDPSIDGPGKS